jgi:predicted nucleotidyltransferase
MNELNLSHLPDLPQRDIIREVAATLWQQPAVIAIWLGGSLARGAGDVYSDIDLRVAVALADLTSWEEPAFELLFACSPVVGRQFLRFGDEAFLHHLILASGVLIDFYVQSSECELSPEPHQVLGCRSDILAVRLAESQTELPAIVPLPPSGEALRSLLVDFWINSHKHCKVLHRNLDLLCLRRIHAERDLLLRLWYLQVCGKDYATARETIHSQSDIVHAVERARGREALRTLGAPTRNRGELVQVIELHHELVSRLGHELAERYSFAYPSALEATVLQAWKSFVEFLPTSDRDL